MSNQRKHYPYEAITSRWGGMKIRDEFGRKIENWLLAFEEEDRPFLIELLGHFQYFSEQRISEKVIDLFQLFKKTYHSDAEKAVYIKPVKEFGTSFSTIFFTAFWLKNNLKDYVEEKIVDLLAENSVPPVIVIVDDFAGSGQTMIKTIDKLLEINSNVGSSKILLLVFLLSDEAECAIAEYADKSDLKIEIVALEKTSSTFKSGFIYNENQVEEKRAIYERLYDRFKLDDDFRYGFGEIASLIAFYYNTPNNTLGLFWQDLAEFCALFPRHKGKKTELKKMQNSAKDRRQSRKNIVTSGIDEGRLNVMMVYCVSHGKRLSFEQMKMDFGLTSEQLDADIRAMVEKGYLEYQNEQFVATPKLKSHMFVSRMKKAKKKSGGISVTEPQFSLHEEYIPLHFD